MSLKDAVFSGSRDQVIAEEAFLDVLEEAAEGMLSLAERIQSGAGREWSRPFVSRLIREVHNVRTVLNDYDAQENRTYSYFMEIVAGIRTFSHVTYILKHLRERFLRSPLHGQDADSERFLAETTETLVWCGDTLRRLYQALLGECDHLGIRIPGAKPPEPDEAGVAPVVRRHLPHNLDEEILKEEGEKVAQVANSFLRFVDMYEALRLNGLESYSELKAFVLGKLDEEHARRMESFVHAIQSKYDTYIQFTSSETKDPDLKWLRSSVSVMLHLLEATTHLVHFYERHENDIRSERTKERIALVVDKKAVLAAAVNFSLRNVGWLARAGAKVCQRLIPNYTSIRELTFPIPENVRLHIRPAALITAIVNHHGTPVAMKMGESQCDASSVTDVIFLAGTHLEARDVTFRGDERPLADLALLFRIGLEDAGRFDLEAALPYLNTRR